MKIQKNVQSAIGGNMSLFCLGFGNDVDYSFLDVMSRQNKGLARRIFLGSDATLQLQVEQKNDELQQICGCAVGRSEELACLLRPCYRVSTMRCPAPCSWMWTSVILRML